MVGDAGDEDDELVEVVLDTEAVPLQLEVVEQTLETNSDMVL